MLLDNIQFSRNKNSKKILHEINITPFVDVILVLLIIFIITSSGTSISRIDVDLPNTTNSKQSAYNNQAIVITIDKEGKIFLFESIVPIHELTKKLLDLPNSSKDSKIIVNADQNIPYKNIISVVSQVHLAGFLKVSFLTKNKFYEK